MKKLIFSLVMLSSCAAFSWGGRGHNTICEVAVYLVKEPGLKEYLQNKPQMMGHVCNMPDFYWKSIGSDVSKLGNPTHFIDVEIIDVPVEKIPLDFKKIMAEYTGTPNKFKKEGTIFSIPTEFGSVWWRADQFVRRIAGLEKDFSAAKVPSNGKEEQDNELPYNKLAFQMVIDMGLMGHFVGDTSQPFHTTADYDGYAAGHGGIHAYFEDTAVGYFDGDLHARILKTARDMKNPAFLKPKTTLEKMKSLSEISRAEIPKILKVDPIIKKSTVVKEKGMEIRTPAERQPGSVGFKRFEKFIVTDMARGSLLLANLWDEAYVKAGRPKLAAYKSYKYPFTVDFVAPDYFEEKTTEVKAK
ncbi:S1/P1 Nuclease [compost metagenome]